MHSIELSAKSFSQVKKKTKHKQKQNTSINAKNSLKVLMKLYVF